MKAKLHEAPRKDYIYGIVGTGEFFAMGWARRPSKSSMASSPVTGGPPVRGGGGMPQRIVTISVPASVLRITGAR
jgi:hypothetical protein